MPGRNGMGPMGRGPRTGRGLGWCGGGVAVDETQEWPGFGPGWRGGRGGRGGGGGRFRHGYRATGVPGWQRAGTDWPGRVGWFAPAGSREQELATLRRQAADLAGALQELTARIDELEPPAADAAPAPGKDQP